MSLFVLDTDSLSLHQLSHPMLSPNVRDFQRVPNLTVENWAA
jgi:predicted nucleic acid-binding protein